MEITKVVKPFLRRGWTNTFGNIYKNIFIAKIIGSPPSKERFDYFSSYIYIYINEELRCKTL